MLIRFTVKHKSRAEHISCDQGGFMSAKDTKTKLFLGEVKDYIRFIIFDYIRFIIFDRGRKPV